MNGKKFNIMLPFTEENSVIIFQPPEISRCRTSKPQRSRCPTSKDSMPHLNAWKILMPHLKASKIKIPHLNASNAWCFNMPCCNISNLLIYSHYLLTYPVNLFGSRYLFPLWTINAHFWLKHQLSEEWHRFSNSPPHHEIQPRWRMRPTVG